MIWDFIIDKVRRIGKGVGDEIRIELRGRDVLEVKLEKKELF